MSLRRRASRATRRTPRFRRPRLVSPKSRPKSLMHPPPSTPTAGSSRAGRPPGPSARGPGRGLGGTARQIGCRPGRTARPKCARNLHIFVSNVQQNVHPSDDKNGHSQLPTFTVKPARREFVCSPSHKNADQYGPNLSRGIRELAWSALCFTAHLSREFRARSGEDDLFE